MAIINFLLVCKKCIDKYKDWEHSTLCGIHHLNDGAVIFSCFNCGDEELFRPDRMEKATKKDAILAREKAEILDELAKKEN